VSFHGLLDAPWETDVKLRRNDAVKVSSKILVLHGFDDPMAPPEKVTAFATEMTDAGADWQVHMYGHTMHAFTNPEANDKAFGTVYDKHADQRSQQAMKNFLTEIFRP
jgi:dienelactone hydrolase